MEQPVSSRHYDFRKTEIQATVRPHEVVLVHHCGAFLDQSVGHIPHLLSIGSDEYLPVRRFHFPNNELRCPALMGKLGILTIREEGLARNPSAAPFCSRSNAVRASSTRPHRP